MLLSWGRPEPNGLGDHLRAMPLLRHPGIRGFQRLRGQLATPFFTAAIAIISTISTTTSYSSSQLWCDFASGS